MKNLTFLSFLFAASIFLSTESAHAAATCSDGDGTVVITDFQALKISGLSKKGIKNGTYNCQVVSVLPGFASRQSSIQCSKSDAPSEVVMAWMIEGLSMFGVPSASAALYVDGEKVFEAGCERI